MIWHGCTCEQVAAYIDNSSAAGFGSLYSADIKYKDVYKIGSNDVYEIGRQENYESNKNKYGDAMFETSVEGNNRTSWQNNSSIFPSAYGTTIRRGGWWKDGGIYAFTDGNGMSDNGAFRPVFVIE